MRPKRRGREKLHKVTQYNKIKRRNQRNFSFFMNKCVTLCQKSTKTGAI